MEQLFLLLRRSSANTALVWDKCQLMSRYKRAILEMKCFWRLGEDKNLIDRLAASVVEERDEGFLARNVFCKESLLQIVSVFTHVAISRRMCTPKLYFRRRQEARRSSMRGIIGSHP